MSKPLLPCGVIQLALVWDETAAPRGGFFTSEDLRRDVELNLSKKHCRLCDGYNLYYGRLRGTAFKWLDLVK